MLTKEPGEIPSGMVQHEAKAFGLNFRDIMIAPGQLDDVLVGHECAGIVTRLGHNTEQSGLKKGSNHADNRLLARVEALGTISFDMGVVLHLVEAAVLRSPQRAQPDDA
jgi:NADPH:quinone reductase-like Zn-dependent oxidoreductase